MSFAVMLHLICKLSFSVKLSMQICFFFSPKIISGLVIEITHSFLLLLLQVKHTQKRKTLHRTNKVIQGKKNKQTNK